MAIVAEAQKILYKISDVDLGIIRRLCLPYKVIGEQVGMSSTTVDMRVARLLGKLGVENRTALVVKALELKLITLNQLVYRNYGDGKRANLS